MLAIGVAGAALGGLLIGTRLAQREKTTPPLPASWPLSARLVFNTSERRLYRQLREAFPQHVVMPKLPLVRLCQPEDLEAVQYWYGLLGSTYVTFTICSPNGKAVLAIDLETRRSRSKRSLEIKEAVLNACDVKYFSMAAEGVPTLDALRLLLPALGAEATPSTPALATVAAEPTGVSGEPAAPTAGGPDRWKDSSVFTMDSFFSPDNRSDTEGEPDADLAKSTQAEDRDGPHMDVAGVVVDDDTPTPAAETTATRTAVR